VQQDVNKARVLRDQKGYKIKRWIFITPRDMREVLQRFVREKVADILGVEGSCIAEGHLQVMLQRHPEIQAAYPDLAISDIHREIMNLRDDLLSGQSYVNFGGDPIDSITGSEPVSPLVECDGRDDEKHLENIIPNLNDTLPAIRHRGYERARRHIACAVWPKISEQLELMWRSRQERNLTNDDFAVIIDLWARGKEIRMAALLIDFWVNDPVGQKQPISSRIHGFLWDALTWDLKTAYDLLDAALKVKSVESMPPDPTSGLLELIKRVIEEQLFLNTPDEIVRRVVEVYKNWKEHEEQYPVLREIKKLLRL
jgi:hypothetical protein